jgi:hypothetical protein
MNDYPLYPELPKNGQLEAQALVGRFKDELIKAAEQAIGELYCDIVPHIESDSWTNYRNHLMDGLRNYSNRKIQGEYDFKKIRQSIYEEFREEIIEDLNQDNLKKIEELEKQIKCLNDCLYRR